MNLPANKRKTLYLRGISEPVVRETKALAARRAMTLTALVEEALTKVVDAQPRREELPKTMLADQEWYQANRKKLLARHEGEYLAVVHQKVIDHDRDFGALAARVFARFGSVPVFLPKCIRSDRQVIVTSPRLKARF